MAKIGSERQNVYTRITNQIIEAIEAGQVDGRMPWHHDGTPAVRPTNAASGKPYRGINVLVLAVQAMTCGFPHRSMGHLPPMG